MVNYPYKMLVAVPAGKADQRAEANRIAAMLGQSENDATTFDGEPCWIDESGNLYHVAAPQLAQRHYDAIVPAILSEGLGDFMEINSGPAIPEKTRAVVLVWDDGIKGFDVASGLTALGLTRKPDDE